MLKGSVVMSFSPFRLGGHFSIKKVRKFYLQCQCGDYFAVFHKTLFSCRENIEKFRLYVNCF
jgi:hypothetical protein